MVPFPHLYNYYFSLLLEKFSLFLQVRVPATLVGYNFWPYDDHDHDLPLDHVDFCRPDRNDLFLGFDFVPAWWIITLCDEWKG